MSFEWFVQALWIVGFLVFLYGLMVVSALAGAAAAKVSRALILWVPLTLVTCVLFEMVYVSVAYLPLCLWRDVSASEAPFGEWCWQVAAIEWDVGSKFGALFGVVGWVWCLKRGAGFTRDPVASKPETVVPPPDLMHKPLREAPPTTPIAAQPPPAGMRCRLSWRDTTLVVEEPRERFLEMMGFPFFMLLVFAVPCLTFGILAHFFGEKHGQNLDAFVSSGIAVGFMILIFLVVVLLSLPSLYARSLIEADRDGMRFKTTGLFGGKVRSSVPNETIAELRLESGLLFLITTRDQRQHVFSRPLESPLPPAEIEWLRDEFIRALKS